MFISMCCSILTDSAQKESLLCEEEDPRDPRNVVYCGYCSTHYKKMVSTCILIVYVVCMWLIHVHPWCNNIQFYRLVCVVCSFVIVLQNCVIVSVRKVVLL